MYIYVCVKNSLNEKISIRQYYRDFETYLIPM